MFRKIYHSAIHTFLTIIQFTQDYHLKNVDNFFYLDLIKHFETVKGKMKAA